MTDEHFDAVVVGSGFGGAVMAYRLAKAKKRVCVLERGKAYPPRSFPRSPGQMRRNLWDPSEGLQGLYDVWSFKDIGAVVSSGLGGGSLIYANVLLRKDAGTFVKEDLDNGGHEHWPLDLPDLTRHYEAVEAMLSARPYPFDHEPYKHTSKTKAFKEAAARHGLAWSLPPLAVTFANGKQAPAVGVPFDEGVANLHGKLRLTCTLCGECDIGCNTGSKNTLDYTYLTHAQLEGADIRPRHEVRSFAPRERTSGYVVDYVEHRPDAEGHKTNTRDLPLKRLTCDKLILAAGALGTTFLMLKNRDRLRSVSDALGTRFSGNGDLLTLAWRAMQTRGEEREPRPIDASHGPVITSAVRVPGVESGGTGRGYYVEEAGFPGFVDWMVQFADAPSKPLRLLKFIWQWLALRAGFSEDTEVSAELAALLGDGTPSLNTLPMLGMGRDIPNGQLFLNGDGLLQSNWQLRKQTEFFARMRKTMQQLAEGMGAEFKDAITLKLNRVLTVHPLGGCPMSVSPRHGVVDDHGEVHGHPGLFIADGSVMPGAVGPNPSLTIAALADRFADRLLET